MDFAGKTVVVTGGSSGIGAALAAGFHGAGAKVCVFDLVRVEPVDDSIPFISCDVADEMALVKSIQTAEALLGSIDIFVSNAGIMGRQPGDVASCGNEDWQRCWSVNVMAHVYAARALLPAMTARGSGYFVNVASAAGLLNQIGDAAYSATKHAAVSFAESLAISHAEDGIGVSLVCPQYVATPLIGLAEADAVDLPSLLTANDVAACVLEAVKVRRFLVLPHADVSRFATARAKDHDVWVSGMTRLRSKAVERFGDAQPERFYRLV